jgi:hypothetical protein
MTFSGGAGIPSTPVTSHPSGLSSMSAPKAPHTSAQAWVSAEFSGFRSMLVPCAMDAMSKPLMVWDLDAGMDTEPLSDDLRMEYSMT